MRNVISPIHFSPVKEQKKPVNASSNGPFFYNQILDMIADLEATRANREENISEKKIPVRHSNNLLYVECRYMKSIDVEA